MFTCSRKVRAARRGFSLLEVLFSVVILAVLTAVAIPLYQGTKANAQLNTCLNNMKAICAAEGVYAQANGAYTTTLATLVGSGLAAVPACPAGGTYTATVTAGALTLKCSTAAHTPANDQALPSP